MNQSYEPHRLVIQHLAILESAPIIVGNVEKIVFGAIDKKVSDWVDSRGDWEGVFDFLDDENSFKPNSWEKDEKGDYCAWYALGCESEKGYLHRHRLSSLCAAVSSRFGLWFEVDVSWITGKRSGSAAAWRNYLAEQFPQKKLAGFELQGGSLFLPIRVDAKVLAEDYPDSLDEALAPIDEALKKLEVAHPEIDALLKAAQKYQFAKLG